MSKLRPCLQTTNQRETATGNTRYLLIYSAVERQEGLCHGRLHSRGMHCAMGSWFDANPNGVLREDFIDEVAAVNDSVPQYSPSQRRAYMLRWLKWKLQSAGYPFKGRPVKQP